jgi:hypothetical protein
MFVGLDGAYVIAMSVKTQSSQLNSTIPVNSKTKKNQFVYLNVRRQVTTTIGVLLVKIQKNGTTAVLEPDCLTKITSARRHVWFQKAKVITNVQQVCLLLSTVHLTIHYLIINKLNFQSMLYATKLRQSRTRNVCLHVLITAFLNQALTTVGLAGEKMSGITAQNLIKLQRNSTQADTRIQERIFVFLNAYQPDMVTIGALPVKIQNNGITVVQDLACRTKRTSVHHRAFFHLIMAIIFVKLKMEEKFVLRSLCLMAVNVKSNRQGQNVL